MQSFITPTFFWCNLLLLTDYRFSVAIELAVNRRGTDSVPETVSQDFLPEESDTADYFSLTEDDVIVALALLDGLITSFDAFDPSAFENTGEEFFEADIYVDVDNPRNAVRDLDLRWPNKTVAFVLSKAFDSRQRAMILAAFLDFERNTCINFVERVNERAYIYIKKSRGCHSQVGRVGRRQELSLANLCFEHQVIIHELMHALGFWHEQSRTDRDDFVTVHWENVIEEQKKQFDKYGQDKIQHLGQPYDFDSVMHYYDTIFSKNGNVTISPKKDTNGTAIGKTKKFSKLDILKLNILYECPGAPPIPDQPPAPSPKPVPPPAPKPPAPSPSPPPSKKPPPPPPPSPKPIAPRPSPTPSKKLPLPPAPKPSVIVPSGLPSPKPAQQPSAPICLRHPSDLFDHYTQYVTKNAQECSEYCAGLADCIGSTWSDRLHMVHSTYNCFLFREIFKSGWTAFVKRA